MVAGVLAFRVEVVGPHVVDEPQLVERALVAIGDRHRLERRARLGQLGAGILAHHLPLLAGLAMTARERDAGVGQGRCQLDRTTRIDQCGTHRSLGVFAAVGAELRQRAVQRRARDQGVDAVGHQRDRLVRRRDAALVGLVDATAPIHLGAERDEFELGHRHEQRRLALADLGRGGERLARAVELRGQLGVRRVTAGRHRAVEQDLPAQERRLVEPRRRRRLDAVELAQRVVEPPVVVGEQRLDVGARRHLDARRREEVRARRIAVLPLDLGPPLLAHAGRQALELAQRALVELALGQRQRVGDAGIVEAPGPRRLQLDQRGRRVAQREVTASERVAARALGVATAGAHLVGDRQHQRAELRAIAPEIVGRRQRRVAGERVDALDPLGEATSQGRAALAGPPLAQAEAERDAGQRDHQRHHRQRPPVAPDRLAQPVAEADRRPRLDRRAVEEPAEIVGQRPRRLVARAAIFLEALGDDRLEIGRDVLIDRAQPRRLVDRQPVEHHQRVVALDRRAPDQERVHRRAQAVHVGPAIELLDLAAGLLGRHELRRAEHGAGGGGAVAPVPRDAEVHDERPQAAVRAALDHDVRRLEIAVDDAGAVRLVDAERGAAHHQRLLLVGELVDQLGQRLPVDVLHRDVHATLDLADLVDLTHPLVGDPGLGAGLGHHAAGDLGVVAAHELDRDVALEADVADQEHPAHAALAEQPHGSVPIRTQQRELVDRGHAPAAPQIERGDRRRSMPLRHRIVEAQVGIGERRGQGRVGDARPQGRRARGGDGAVGLEPGQEPLPGGGGLAAQRLGLGAREDALAHHEAQLGVGVHPHGGMIRQVPDAPVGAARRSR